MLEAPMMLRRRRRKGGKSTDTVMKTTQTKNMRAYRFQHITFVASLMSYGLVVSILMMVTERNNERIVA
ncbi:MAG TPA: hypothetical protein VER14_05700 [Phototrophicaceae bacterium]|nr:hypothetical protein [Phototrophicaceae bacterium]